MISVFFYFSVLLLMALHLYIFTLFGMLLFPKQTKSVDPSIIVGGIEGTAGNGSGNGTQVYKSRLPI